MNISNTLVFFYQKTRLTFNDLLFELFETGIAVDPVPVGSVVVACTNHVREEGSVR